MKSRSHPFSYVHASAREIFLELTEGGYNEWQKPKKKEK
jgi:hypothetical protein